MGDDTVLREMRGLLEDIHARLGEIVERLPEPVPRFANWTPESMCDNYPEPAAEPAREESGEDRPWSDDVKAHEVVMDQDAEIARLTVALGRSAHLAGMWQQEVADAKAEIARLRQQVEDADEALAACRAEAGGRIEALTKERDAAPGIGTLQARIGALKVERDAALAREKALREALSQIARNGPTKDDPGWGAGWMVRQASRALGKGE